MKTSPIQTWLFASIIFVTFIGVGYYPILDVSKGEKTVVSGVYIKR